MPINTTRAALAIKRKLLSTAAAILAPLVDLTQVLPQVALPALPTKGGTFADPTFPNVPILRLTDATDGVGDEYPDYSYWGSMNLHEKLVILLTGTGSGTSFVELNPDSFTAAGQTIALTRYTPTGLLGKYVEGTWSQIFADVMYAPANAGGGPKVCRLDMTNRSAPTETTFDFSGKTFGGQTVLAGDYFGQMLMASDEDTFSVSWFSSSYAVKGIAVGRLSTLSLLYVLADTTIDECNITRDGLYVHATWGPPGQSGTGYRNLEIKVADGTSQGFLDNATDLSVGHHVPIGSGNAILGYQDTVNKLVSYSLSSPAAKTTIWDYNGNFALGDIHLSSTAVDQSYALVTEEQKDNDATNAPLVGELWLVKLDGSQTGMRVARHYSLQDHTASDYYQQSRANFSPSRRFVVGSSNMGNTAGRKDAYLWYVGAAIPWNDFIPNAFVLPPVTGAIQATVYTSSTITVSGLGASDTSPIRVLGTGVTYAKNGGAYTSAVGTVVNGDTVSVRLTSAATASTAVSGTLSIGGVTATYVVTTAASANLVTGNKTASPAGNVTGFSGTSTTFASVTLAASASDAGKDRLVVIAVDTADAQATTTFSVQDSTGRVYRPVAQSSGYAGGTGKALTNLFARRVFGSEALQTADIVVRTNAAGNLRASSIGLHVYNLFNSAIVPAAVAVKQSATSDPVATAALTMPTEGYGVYAASRDGANGSLALTPTGLTLDAESGINDSANGNYTDQGVGHITASGAISIPNSAGSNVGIAAAAWGHAVTTPTLSYVGASATVESASGSLTLTEPANTASGDLLVAAISYRGTGTFTAPAGWTIVAQDNSVSNTTANGTGSIGSTFLAYAIRGASAPSYAFTRTAGDVAIGGVACFRPEGGSTGVSLDGTATSTILASASANVAGAGLTTTANHALVVMACCSARNANASAEKCATAPVQNDWGECFDTGTATGADAGVALAYAFLPTAGATGVPQYTASASARHGVVLAAFKVT